MNYQSRYRLLGLPLVHVNTGVTSPGGYRRGVAVGWIAVGDVSFGVVSIGGVAVGGVAIGGIAAGLLVLAGAAIGLASLGGLAVGVLAVGGAAFGWVAAVGGLAVARDFASGGVALATHANDAAAAAYVAGHPFLHAATRAADYAIVLVVLPGAMALAARIRAWRRSRSGPHRRGGSVPP
jgi:hypothetical protein